MLERSHISTFSALTVLALAGCGDSSSTGGTTSTGASGATCAPGQGCPAVTSDCIGLVDNSALGTFALRISHLSISKPAALTGAVVKGLLDQGISLNLPNCKSQSGDTIFPTTAQTGAFSWILEFDKATGKLRTGGAKPVEDPTGGYCFVNETVQGLPIAPLSMDAPISGGMFQTAVPADVTVPVYSDRTAGTVILLPLRGLRIHDAKISSDDNCIGSYNKDKLQAGAQACLTSMDTPQFIDGASLDGFVELEKADGVKIDQLAGESLCLLLTGNTTMYGDPTGKVCKRDGNNKIVFQGDWCAATNSAATATCADAISLGATFAASSVPVKTNCP